MITIAIQYQSDKLDNTNQLIFIFIYIYYIIFIYTYIYHIEWRSITYVTPTVPRSVLPMFYADRSKIVGARSRGIHTDKQTDIRI